jgi:hypothetical protein
MARSDLAATRMPLHLVVVALSILFGVGAAPDAAEPHGWFVDGKPAPDEPGRKHDGPFRAQLVLSGEAKALQERWSREPGTLPVRGMARAAPGARAETVVFFAGCQADAAGSCSVWGEARVDASDGRVLADGIEVPLWVGRPAPAPPALGISEHGIGLVVEDFAGSYAFRMVVTDRNAGRTVALVQELAVARGD